MIDLRELTIEEMKQFASDIGEKPFRGKQLYKWVSRGVTEFDDMTDFSKELRTRLNSCAFVGKTAILDVQKDSQDGTCKFLYGLDEKVRQRGQSPLSQKVGQRGLSPLSQNAVEGVFMKYKYGNTLCISSQVGCRMGCRFCASALGGFVRNLTAGEMLGQIMAAEEYTGEHISHIVVMGMGEPFDNYENLAKFLRLLHEPEGRNMSYRNMTVSTCGLIPKMKQFAEEFPQVNLAISLHRADETRSEIMPVNRKYPVDEVLQTAREISSKTGRRITFEYALIRGENDRPADIETLTRKLRGMLCHVNLIPLNRVEETGYEGTARSRAQEIAAQLEKSGIPATVRREL